MVETYYDLLEIDPDASQDEIKAAWKEATKQYHPDQNESPDAEETFKNIKTAYEVLSDESERQRYDALGHAAYTNSDDSSSHRGAQTGDHEPYTASSQTAGGSAKTRIYVRGRPEADPIWTGTASPSDDTHSTPSLTDVPLLKRVAAYAVSIAIPGSLSLVSCVSAVWIYLNISSLWGLLLGLTVLAVAGVGYYLAVFAAEIIANTDRRINDQLAF